MGLGRALVSIAWVLSCLGCSTIRPGQSNRLGLLDQWSGTRSSGMREAPPRETPRMWGWSWPLNSVTITSTYGERGQSFHEGVDLKAGVGTPVFAAHSGIVRYAGSKISGYGKLVVIRDEGSGLSTIYAHNSKLFVKTGQRVKQGRKISLSGKTGHATGPHLHFEVRQGTLALDPLKILAPPGSKRTLASRK